MEASSRLAGKSGPLVGRRTRGRVLSGWRGTVVLDSPDRQFRHARHAQTACRANPSHAFALAQSCQNVFAGSRMPARPPSYLASYFAWGCFRYFGYESLGGHAAGLPGRSSRPRRPWPKALAQVGSINLSRPIGPIERMRPRSGTASAQSLARSSAAGAAAASAPCRAVSA